MNPIDKIKSGIESNDMRLVSEGFEDLTGEKVSPTHEEIVIEEEVPREEPDDNFITSTRSSESSEPEGNSRIARAEPITLEERENTFVDDGSEAPEDFEIDKKLAIKAPVERKRKAFKKVSIICVLCKKDFEIHPTLVRENYKCDNCITRR
jgi:hypothetical protein